MVRSVGECSKLTGQLVEVGCGEADQQPAEQGRRLIHCMQAKQHSMPKPSCAHLRGDWMPEASPTCRTRLKRGASGEPRYVGNQPNRMRSTYIGHRKEEQIWMCEQ